MKPTIHDRLLLLLKAVGGRQTNPDVYVKDKGTNLVNKGFWQRLEAESGVRSSKWRLFASGSQKATPELIEATARMWPQYAFWLATGVTDIANGHAAPDTATTFPEYSHGEDENSTYYFKQSIKLLDMVLEGTKTTAALDRNYVAGSLWVGGKALENAYVVCKSDDYQELDAAWKYRESKRDIHKGYLTGDRRPWLEKKKGTKKEKGDTALESSTPKNPLTAHQDQWDLFYKPKPSE